MFHRLINTPKSRSFLLFGARGTGKSTLVRERFDPVATHLINLLDLDVESRLALDPMRLEREVLALPPSITHVALDEVQKLPRLLDVVHNLIETHKVPQVFILTGSSARKLKAGGGNLLAGRAAVRHLYPLTHTELGAKFDLETAIEFGTLPKIWNTDDLDERRDTLRAYANAYLKEEVWAEHLVRRLDPFRRFLEVAALQSGKIVNYSKIARDVGADIKTVQSWYEILEDTLIGFHLEAFHSSVRKQLRQAPKFYLGDTGVTRALAHMLGVRPAEQTSYYGQLFEQLVISELNAHNQYHQLDFQLSYLMTKAEIEVDLVVKRPGRPLALVEIKSSRLVKEEHFNNLKHFAADFPDADFFLWTRDPQPQNRGRIRALDWKQGILALAED